MMKDQVHILGQKKKASLNWVVEVAVDTGIFFK